MEDIILVDEQDNEIGVGEKMPVHREGKLHRAISVFVFDSEAKMLIQKRASNKYHCPGLWTNTCCSHPMPGETAEQAAHRRLKQEMGFDCELKEKFCFIYKKEFENGLTENEFDHVFVGEINQEKLGEDGDNSEIIKPDPAEVEEWKWISVEELKKDIMENPEKYTCWFKICIGRDLC